MSHRHWIWIAVGFVGCSQPATSDEARHRPRELSTQPVWTAAGPPADGLMCFGASVAVADLDDDGHPDLVVGEPPCQGTFGDIPGRVLIYRGVADGPFSDTPVVTELTWPNPTLRAGTSQALRADDLDGDGRSDLVVSARGGVQLFTGISDLAQPLGEPTFHITATGAFGPTAVGDFDGDGSSEIVSVRASVATMYRVTAGALVAGRTFPQMARASNVGDWNTDGLPDLLLRSVEGSHLHVGCTPPAAGCEDGVASVPAWSSEQQVVGIVPDVDRDGLGEVMIGGFGLVALHLSDPVTGYEATPVWSALGDPNYPGFGSPVYVPGDLDGDRRQTEFLLASAGRLYAFFPQRHHLDRLEPGFAWPRRNNIQAQLLAGEPVFGNSGPVVASASIDGNRAADLVVGVAPEYGEFALSQAGKVYVYAGGKLPKTRLDDPFLLGTQSCPAPVGNKPDLFVDDQAIARSLHVDHLEFAADACELVEGCVGAPGDRKLLRFATSIANFGGAPLVIPGPETAPELYQFDECHGHDHLADFARYELLDASGAVVAAGRKQGFFLVDIAPYCTDGPAPADYYPDQGISPGWSDVYVASLPCQWLDVTGVPDGLYTLEVEADTNSLVDQDDVFSDVARVRVRIKGDRVDVL